ncbi:MAG: CPXCG motif-containing cysteine-rich protein [bacterium]|nr:CPXCG motif-containing cysteine-rich protein [Candidatus Kapabacteria bacterium]
MNDDFSDLDWAADDDEQVIAHEHALTPVPYDCASCGEANQTMLDPGGGFNQRYTEDCEVCCRPNLLTLAIDPESRVVSLSNELEYS